VQVSVTFDSPRKEVSSVGNHDGEQWVGPDGTIHTVNPTNDPNVPGGFYHSQRAPDGSAKATAVYNPDYTFADVKANKDWQ
jgi:hypothetical protein